MDKKIDEYFRYSHLPLLKTGKLPVELASWNHIYNLGVGYIFFEDGDKSTRIRRVIDLVSKKEA